MLRRIATSDDLFVSLARARQRLRIDAIESDGDNDLTALITAATATLESRIGQALLPTTFDLLLPAERCWSWGTWKAHWPSSGRSLDIPMAPVRDVVGIFYTDTAGDEQEVAASDYTFQRTTEGARVSFASGFSAPSVDSVEWPVRVRFDAGYDIPGTSGAGDDPELARDPRAEMAILFLVGHWNENREAAAPVDIKSVPMAFEMLADQLRVYR